MALRVHLDPLSTFDGEQPRKRNPLKIVLGANRRRLVEVPRYGVHGPRLFALLLGVREAAPPEEWYHKAVKEVQKTEMRFAERIRMRLAGYIYIGHRTKPGWRGSLPFYKFKCPVHGLVENYPQGFNQTLVCPRCQEEAER